MREFVLGLFCLLAVTLCLISFLPIIDTYMWWVRMMDFPRLQLSIALLLLAIGIAFFIKHWVKTTTVLLGVIAVALVYHGIALFPYVPTGSDLLAQDCPRDSRLSVMVVNVRLMNEPSGQLAPIVQREEPDLLLAMETDEAWNKALKDLRDQMPYAVERITGSYFGIHLLSRLPLVSPEIRFLAQQDTPQVVTGVKLRDGETIDFLGIHPRPPHPSQSALGRDAVLQKAAFIIRDGERPAVVAGDLNATPWESATSLMRRVGRLIDPRQGYGYVATYDARSWWTSWPLDHIFYEAGFATVLLERLSAFGSDHYPYLARLCRVTDISSDVAPEPEQEAIDRARQIIELARQRAS